MKTGGEDKKIRSKSGKEKIVLFVGRIEGVKGIHVLSGVIPAILQQEPDVRFILGGEDLRGPKGEEEIQRLREFFKQHGVEDKVLLTGYLDQEALLMWYRRADIAVVPSLIYESFSYTCAQAMAMGVPVVAYRQNHRPSAAGSIHDVHHHRRDRCTHPSRRPDARLPVPGPGLPGRPRRRGTVFHDAELPVQQPLIPGTPHRRTRTSYSAIHCLLGESPFSRED